MVRYNAFSNLSCYCVCLKQIVKRWLWYKVNLFHSLCYDLGNLQKRNSFVTKCSIGYFACGVEYARHIPLAFNGIVGQLEARETLRVGLLEM